MCANSMRKRSVKRANKHQYEQQQEKASHTEDWIFYILQSTGPRCFKSDLASQSNC